MRSFGLYYKKENPKVCPLVTCPIVNQKVENLIDPNDKHQHEGQEIIEVHCNLWKILEKKGLRASMLKDDTYQYFLDFGLMFHPSIKEIVLHLPFEFHEQSLSDLGEKLNDQEICSLIFNDNAQTTSSARNFHLITFSGKRLLVYPISDQNLKFESTKEITSNKQEYPGTNIIISIKSNPQEVLKELILGENIDNVRIYVRFRLILSENELRNIQKKEFLSTDIIQSIFSKNEMFDFRINDDREINRKLDEDLRSKSYLPFRMNKVHFLFMSDTRNPIVQASETYRTRFLETEKWSEYVGVPIPDSMLAYHWKDKKEKTLEIKSAFPINPVSFVSEHIHLILKQIPYKGMNYTVSDNEASYSTFKLFFMLTYPHRNWGQVLFYAFIAIFLGWLGSVFSSLMFNVESNWIRWCVFGGVFGLCLAIIWFGWRGLKKKSRVNFP